MIHTYKIRNTFYFRSFERELDPISPFVTPLTYEGLINDLIGIEYGKVRPNMVNKKIENKTNDRRAVKINEKNDGKKIENDINDKEKGKGKEKEKEKEKEKVIAKGTGQGGSLSDNNSSSSVSVNSKINNQGEKFIFCSRNIINQKNNYLQDSFFSLFSA